MGAVQTICTVNIQDGMSTLWTDISLSTGGGAVPLDQFVISVRPHASGSFHIIASAAVDFTTSIDYPILGCTDDLTTASDGSDYAMSMEVKALDAVRFAAAMSGATSSDVEITISWSQR